MAYGGDDDNSDHEAVRDHVLNFAKTGMRSSSQMNCSAGQWWFAARGGWPGVSPAQFLDADRRQDWPHQSRGLRWPAWKRTRRPMSESSSPGRVKHLKAGEVIRFHRARRWQSRRYRA